MDSISWSEFEKVELRAGTVVEVKEFPEARKPAFKLKIDFGESIGIKQASAQIKDLYSAKDLEGEQLTIIPHSNHFAFAWLAQAGYLTTRIKSLPGSLSPNSPNLGCGFTFSTNWSISEVVSTPSSPP